MAPVRFFGKKGVFPRVGAWAVTISPPGQVGILFAVSDKEVELHLQDTKGETIDPPFKTTPSNVRVASYDEIESHLSVRKSPMSPFDAAVMGYTVTDSQVKSMTALQRKLLGKSLDDADAAQGLIEESQAQLLLLQAQKIAAHPEAIALEAQIETERLAFVADVEARRNAMVAKLSASK